MRCSRPATLTSKNSSRLPAEMARNLTRSSRGLRLSLTSSSTRRLKASHEVSRLIYRDGSETERFMRTTGSGLEPFLDDLRPRSILVLQQEWHYVAEPKM